MNDCVYLGTDLLASSLFVEDEFFGPNRLQALPSERVSASINKMAKSMVESYHMLNKEAMQVSLLNVYFFRAQFMLSKVENISLFFTFVIYNGKIFYLN